MQTTTPFNDAVTWPEYVRTVFEACLENPGGSGLLNNLMYYCLCMPFPCMVMRRILDPPKLDPITRRHLKHPPNERIVSYDCLTVGADPRPFIMFQVEDSEWAGEADLRLRADKQMRLGLDHILPCCSNTHFWGLSVLGSSLRVYRADVATKSIEPPPEPLPVSGALPSDYLEGAWNINILSQEGFDKMKEIVQDLATFLPPKPPNW